MVDKDTLSSLQPVYVGNNNSTRNRIEQAKRDYESIEKEIKNKEDEMTGKMTSACQARSMPSICFFISVSSFALLFSGAIENRFLHFAHYFCSIFCIASIVYLLAGWIYGEHENPRRFCNFASFRNATLGFIILASLSVVAALALMFLFPSCFDSIFDATWWWLLMVYVVFSFANYCIFFRKIGKSVNALKQEVCTFVNDVQPRCNESTAEIDKLLKTQQVIIEIMSDDQKPNPDNSKDAMS